MPRRSARSAMTRPGTPGRGERGLGPGPHRLHRSDAHHADQRRPGARPAGSERAGVDEAAQQGGRLGEQCRAGRLVDAVVRRRGHEMRRVGQAGQQQPHAAQVEHRVGPRDRLGEGLPGLGAWPGCARGRWPRRPARRPSGSGACTAVPSTIVAATSPPNTLAAAFSGCPSWAAATAKGSSAPAAAAAAAASAAEEPNPRATGICERTVTAKRSWPSTSVATRAARCDASSKSPDPSPSLCTRSEGAGSTSTLT